jgi:hypothetical protein
MTRTDSAPPAIDVDERRKVANPPHVLRALPVLLALSLVVAVLPAGPQSVYSDQDVLVFERQSGQDMVLVAVNRSDARTTALPGPLNLAPGTYGGALTDTSDINAKSLLTVAPGGGSTLFFDRLGALVVRANPSTR